MGKCVRCGYETEERIGDDFVCEDCELSYLREQMKPYIQPYCRKHLQDDAAGPGYIKAWVDSLERIGKTDMLLRIYNYIHMMDSSIEEFDREFATGSPDFYDFVKENM